MGITPSVLRELEQRVHLLVSQSVGDLAQSLLRAHFSARAAAAMPVRSATAPPQSSVSAVNAVASVAAASDALSRL